MSVKTNFRDGVFVPIEQPEGLTPGRIYTAFAEDELCDFRQTLGWLKSAEKSFDFWNNEDDAVYDSL